LKRDLAKREPQQGGRTESWLVGQPLLHGGSHPIKSCTQEGKTLQEKKKKLKPNFSLSFKRSKKAKAGPDRYCWGGGGGLLGLFHGG